MIIKADATAFASAVDYLLAEIKKIIHDDFIFTTNKKRELRSIRESRSLS